MSNGNIQTAPDGIRDPARGVASGYQNIDFSRKISI
jgi:hypothetical protein